MLEEQFQRYLDDVEKAARDCAAAVRRLVNKGPPLYINDAHGLPLPEGETHIAQLWFSDDGSEVSALLKVTDKSIILKFRILKRRTILQGALQGEERDNLWNSQKEVRAELPCCDYDPIGVK
jgi:hypothetical protein